jgi:hypothetical protein
MSDIRTEWIATMQKYWLSSERPDSENFWCTRLDTVPQEELRAIQSEKLRVAGDTASNAVQSQACARSALSRSLFSVVVCSQIGHHPDVENKKEIGG